MPDLATMDSPMNTKIVFAISIALLVMGCSPDRGQPVEPQAGEPSAAQAENEQEFQAIQAAATAVSDMENRSMAAGDIDPEDATGALITVHKTATCGCCAGWVDHLRRENFHVRVVDHPHLNDIKQEMGVPNHLHSCHTGEINGLFVEGHVPAQDIRDMIKLARDDQAIEGIAVPGMPMGSPGMEAGGQVQPYDVILVAGEEESVLNSHGTR